MRFALAAASGAALAGAIVIPGLPADFSVNKQSRLSAGHPHDADESKHDALWAGRLPSKDALVSTIGETADRLASAFDSAVDAVEDARHELSDKLTDILSGHDDDDKHKHHHLTIYELIQHSEYTTKFAKIVDEHPSIVKLLNSTKANHTLFVPTDAAFKDVPHDEYKQPRPRLAHQHGLICHWCLRALPLATERLTHKLILRFWEADGESHAHGD